MNHIRMGLVAASVLGISSLMLGQEPAREPKAPKQEEPRSMPAERPEEAKPPKQDKQEAQKPPRQESEKPLRDMKPNHEERAEPGRSERANNEHARPAGKGAHIPEARFRQSFGRGHSFRVNRVVNEARIVPGQTQFVYSGYTFVFVDPWPAEWAYTDDCYVDYMNDEYVLVDVLHPGVYVTLLVVG
jgi:hypothetical protein